MTGMLSSLASVPEVDNVVIFISDSLRFDYLPSRIAEMGVTARAISACSMTASSLPSITTGRYPENHCVWSFNDRLRSVPHLLDKAPNMGFNETTWTHLEPEEKPPLLIHRLRSQTSIEELEEPFIYVHHDQGGHSPYGSAPSEISSKEYFASMSADYQQIPDDYEAGVAASAERFMAIIEHLRERGALENTLVMFTSDHGELLGEDEYGRIYGHGPPIVPEVVSVPVTFLGAGLPRGKSLDVLLSGVDVAPTAMGALGWSVPENVDGTDIWTDRVDSPRPVKSEIWQDGRNVTIGPASVLFSQYKATSLWNQSGGVVRHMNSVPDRLLKCHYSHLVGAAHASVCRTRLSPRSYRSLVMAYLQSSRTYGTPRFTNATLDEHLPRTFERNAPENNRPNIDEDHLRKLGYVE